jgi:uncharacterized protein YnzC (UPF0291/DUF896 family)
MADNQGPGSTPAPIAGGPGPQPGQPQPQVEATAVERPDYIPEKFWDGEKKSPRVEDLAKSYVKLEGERGKFKETLTAEINTERLRARPEKPDGYKVAVPETIKDVVILDKPPGEDFKPEAGKHYAVIKPGSSLMKNAAELAHKYGVPQAEFSGLVADLAREIGFKPPTAEEAQAAKQAIYSKLGEQGEQRVAHIGRQLAALVGAQHAAAMDATVESPAQIEAIEALLEKAGQAKLSPGTATVAPGLTEKELQKIQGESDYWTNPDKQAKVRAGFLRLYPPT